MLYVEAPLDVCLQYFAKVHKFAHSVPYSVALDLTQKRDIGDREMWVDLHRKGKSTLGYVIKRTSEVREAVWQVPEEFRRSKDKETGTPKKRREARSRTPPRPTAKDHFKGTRLTGKDIVDTMKNDEKLCRQFQFGQCKTAQPCPNGRHQCARKMNGGRVCGGSHPAVKCTVGQGAEKRKKH